MREIYYVHHTRHTYVVVHHGGTWEGEQGEEVNDFFVRIYYNFFFKIANDHYNMQLYLWLDQGINNITMLECFPCVA